MDGADGVGAGGGRGLKRAAKEKRGTEKKGTEKEEGVSVSGHIQVREAMAVVKIQRTGRELENELGPSGTSRGAREWE